MSALPVYTVTELTAELRALVGDAFDELAVTGEISGFRHILGSGHMYFDLKDQNAVLHCAMFERENIRLFFTPQNGMQVIARGRLDLYAPRGNYQLKIEAMRVVGEGELALAFDRLKMRLAAEGLFDEAHKKPLLSFPERVGVVTSPSGAAIADIIDVAGRRAPWVTLVLRPTRVQGEGAAEDIARAIEDFNTWGEVDLLIVGRGGGSVEDLWAFNEEIVARAIYESRIPIISAVGHEIDFTIADLAADLRAPTPSAACEMALPDRRELSDRVSSLTERARQAVVTSVDQSAGALDVLASRYGLRRFPERLDASVQRVDDLMQSAYRAVTQRIKDTDGRWRALAAKHGALDPALPFRRGYSLTERLPERSLVTDAKTLTTGDRVAVRFRIGEATLAVEATRPVEPAESAAREAS